MVEQEERRYFQTINLIVKYNNSQIQNFTIKWKRIKHSKTGVKSKTWKIA